jgi:hypothetical protein
VRGFRDRGGAGAFKWMLNDFPQGFNERENAFGMYRGDGTAKPVVAAFKELGTLRPVAAPIAAAPAPPAPSAATPAPVAPTAQTQPAPGPTRYFSETGFRIDHDAIWDYFSSRGRVDTFGFPVSRTFILDGCQVQVFQRLVAQVCPGRPGVSLLNLLDPEIFPYTQVNFSSFPAPNEKMKDETPTVGQPNYAERILAYVSQHAPNDWEGAEVAFGSTFFGLISAETAGTSDAGILRLLNLEIWGAPISPPRRDPANASFVYQRFQRGIMHHNADSGLTRGILLADYLKQLIRGVDDLPPDLRQQAESDLKAGKRSARYFDQYCPGFQNSICRPADLPLGSNNLVNAFEPE